MQSICLCAMSLACVYTTVSLGKKSSLQLQHQIIHRPLRAQEKPQVVDEVAVPSIPTGIDKAQLLRVNAARCRRQRAMCSKEGQEGESEALAKAFSSGANLTHVFGTPLDFCSPLTLRIFQKRGGASLLPLFSANPGPTKWGAGAHCRTCYLLTR